MSTLTLTTAAIQVIQKELQRSSIDNAVVNLMVRSEMHRAHPEVSRAIIEGRDDSIIKELMSKHHEAGMQNPQKQLFPAVHPRGQIPAEALVEVSGITFGFPPQVLTKMKGWTLDVEDGHLVLRDHNGKVMMPPY